MEAFEYHVKRAKLYCKALALKAEGKNIMKISGEMSIPYSVVYSWIRLGHKPILVN